MCNSAAWRSVMRAILVISAALWSAGSAAASQMYWTNISIDQILSAELDGSGQTTIAGGGDFLGITVDVAAGKLYWTVSLSVSGVSGSIRRSNLDGTAVEVLVDGSGGTRNPSDIKLDLLAGKLYWTDNGTPGPRIMRANLDGTASETVFFMFDHRGPDFGSGPGQTFEFGSVWGLALDPVAGDMYWTDFFGGDIHRAKLDGTGVSGPLVAGLATPRGLVLDLAAGQMYWTEQQDSTIYRSALDGSGVQLIADDLVGVDEAFGLAIDPVPGKLYWTNQGSGAIQRADLDGQNVESLALFPGQDLIGIALVPTPPAVPGLSTAGQVFLVGLVLSTVALGLVPVGSPRRSAL